MMQLRGFVFIYSIHYSDLLFAMIDGWIKHGKL